REVADAAADLEDLLPDVGLDEVRHPLIETRRTREARERRAAVLVGGEDVVGCRELRDGGERLHAVAPADLLAFLIRATRIRDGHLEEARAALRELDGEL